MIKKIIFIITALIGAFIIYMIASYVIVTNAKLAVYTEVYRTANETGDYDPFLKLNQDYHKPVTEVISYPEDVAFQVRLFQTVTYENNNYAFHYYVFITGLAASDFISTAEEYINQYPQMKIWQIRKDETVLDEPKLIFDTNQDQTTNANIGGADVFAQKYDEMKGYFYSTPALAENGQYRIELYKNTGEMYYRLDFIQNEPYNTDTLTEEQFRTLFDTKTEYIKGFDTETIVNDYINKEINMKGMWITLIIYFVVVVGLWFLFFHKKRYAFTNR